MSNRKKSLLAGFAGQHRRALAITLALGLAATLSSLLLMFASGYLISATAQVGMTLFAVMLPVACVQLFGLGKPAAAYFERLVSHDWVLNMTSGLRRLLFDALSNLSLQPGRKAPAGEQLSMLSDDVANVQNLYLRVVFPTVIGWVVALVVGLVLGILGPVALLVGLVSLFALGVGIPLLSLLVTRSLSYASNVQATEAASKAMDDLSGSADWILSGRSSQAASDNALLFGQWQQSQSSLRLRQRVLTLLQTVSLGVVACLVMAFAAQVFGAGGTSDNPNYIAAFALGFMPLIETLAVLPSALTLSPTYRDSETKLASLTEGAKAEQASMKPDLGEAPAIRLSDVAYAYPGQSRDALAVETLEIPFGQSVAILGRSGSGKSTLMGLLRGVLHAQAGAIEIGGRRLKGNEDLSDAIGYISQTPYLFNRTIRDNLTIGADGVDDDVLYRVLRSVGLEEPVSETRSGLDTVVGETGRGFSGGETHRMALARVLIKNTPIVLVDEPFASLDSQTEEQVLATMLEACSGRTLVVVTHHLSHIDRFDRVLYLEGGRILLDGPSEKLAQTNEHFKNLLSFDCA